MLIADHSTTDSNHNICLFLLASLRWSQTFPSAIPPSSQGPSRVRSILSLILSLVINETSSLKKERGTPLVILNFS